LQAHRRERPASDESLRIEVLDIELAGWFNPFWPGSSYLRIVSEIYWPSIKLRYTLTRGDEVIASGEEQLVDKTYLMTVTYSEEDRFRYEKPMLDDWFGRRFGFHRSVDDPRRD
jgi:Protein of unknown function (DUF3016)